MKKTQWLILLLFAVFSASLFADDGKVHEYQLKNGLKVVVREDHRAPVAIVEVWYKVGSSYEPDGITGISHALEHMMFRGSKNYSVDKMTQMVSENGVEQNAFTSTDFTGYYEYAGRDKLPMLFQFEADRMRGLLLREQDFAKEIQIVMEERRMRYEDNPQQQTYERYLTAANIATPYHHPAIGWMSDLQQMTVHDLQGWYDKWYAPNNAILVVVGDVDPENVRQMAEHYFGPLKPSVLPQLKKHPEIKPLGVKTLEVNLPAKVPYLIMGYNTPSVNTASIKWEPYALSVLEGILGGGDSARLQQNLVRGQQIASAINVDYNNYARLDTLFTIQAIAAPNHTVEEIKNATLAQIKQLQDQPVSPAELERVKAQVIANYVYALDSIPNQANQIGSLEAVGLPWQEADNFVAQVKAVTAQQVQAVAQKYLILNRLTIAKLNPLPIQKGQVVPTGLGGPTNVR